VVGWSWLGVSGRGRSRWQSWLSEVREQMVSVSVVVGGGVVIRVSGGGGGGWA
jgi:hypothetical protein